MKYRPDIDGLRALAVVPVVLFHANVPGFAGGFVGVDVFFVISGFLITGLLLREGEKTGGISLLGFYARPGHELSRRQRRSRADRPRRWRGRRGCYIAR